MVLVLDDPRNGTRQPQAKDQPDRASSEIASRLAASGYPPLQHLRCETIDGVVVLSGTVPSYYLKQMAQTVAGKAAAVQQVENRLEVRWNQRREQR